MNASNYLPLARKYRPSTFAELCGQGATATALANAIKMGREPHAVIFSGVRGVGKTTSARLYAKALNCKTPVNSEPCNECDSCIAINLGNHEDVMEIDGASNTSVDDIRALRETVSYVAQRSRFKVYIIDEVHMLSQSAFNALLKTLEEPPAHVVFVFATTELQKIPQTIMSRCQIFHLQKLSLLTIRERLTKILIAEKIPHEEKAVVAIAREGHGSMRDALTLLDHAIAVGDGVVSTTALEKIISHVSSSSYLQLLDALVSRNPNTVIETLDSFEDAGINMKDVAEKTAIMARHAFIVRDVGLETLDFKSIGFDDEECRHLSEIALKSGPTDLNRLFRTLAKACLDLDGSEIDRYILENYSLEWCLDPGTLITHKQTAHDSSGDKKAQRSPNSGKSDQTKSLVTDNRITVADIRGSLGSKNNISNETMDAAKPATIETSQPILEKKILEQKTKSSAEPENNHIQPKSLPDTWRSCVEVWKKHNPLQAKKLEDIHPKDYSPQRIELVIPVDSFLSATLLKADEQKKLKDTFAELFGYTNPIIFRAKSADERIESTFSNELPESLASIQLKESSSRKEKITNEARNNPTTQDAIQLFNATIESVEPCLESQE
jgi:DNA polymerase III subunit gamma/tau